MADKKIEEESFAQQRDRLAKQRVERNPQGNALRSKSKVNSKINEIEGLLDVVISKLVEAREKNKNNAFDAKNINPDSLHQRLQKQVVHFTEFRGELNHVKNNMSRNSDDDKMKSLVDLEAKIKPSLLALKNHKDKDVKRIGGVVNKVVEKRAEAVHSSSVKPEIKPRMKR